MSGSAQSLGKSAPQTCVEVGEVLRCSAKGAVGALWTLRAQAKSDFREECVKSYENHHGDLARIKIILLKMVLQEAMRRVL